VKREYTVIVEQGENGYLIGTVPAVRGCFTQGKDLDELMENIKEVLELCLEELGEEAQEPPRFLGVHRIAV
jgi:predicted RNase H-like HicB family nuclease